MLHKIFLFLLNLFFVSPGPAEKIEIVPYDPVWPQVFEREASPICSALGENCISIHHFGSTSIPFLEAKPKIDILAEVTHLDAIDTSSLEALGFEARGEVIPSGRYFSKKNPRVHLHIFEVRNPLIQRNLLFRDWLRAHEEDRFAYAELKKNLLTNILMAWPIPMPRLNSLNRLLQRPNARLKSLKTYRFFCLRRITWIG